MISPESDNTIILIAENRQLQATNTRVQKKRTRKTVFISRGGVLIDKEVLEGQDQPITYDEVRIQVVELSSYKVSIRTLLPIYSLYKSLEHTACRYPEHQ